MDQCPSGTVRQECGRYRLRRRYPCRIHGAQRRQSYRHRPLRKALKVADLHGMESGVQVRYEKIAAEDLAARETGQFDVVTCMEMLEHVPDPASIVRACAALAKPGGHVFFSTLNRN